MSQDKRPGETQPCLEPIVARRNQFTKWCPHTQHTLAKCPGLSKRATNANAFMSRQPILMRRRISRRPSAEPQFGQRTALLASVVLLLTLHGEVSDGSQPPLRFDLSQPEAAGFGSLDRLVG